MGLKLFNEEGVEKFLIRKVVVMCNVSYLVLYKYFKNKEELINVIFEYVFYNFKNLLNEIVEKYKDNLDERII